MKRLMLVAVLLMATGWAMAQEPAPATAPAGEGVAPRAHATDTHPVLPENPTWAGSMVIVIIGLFIAAAVIGVVVRLNMPEQPPEPVHDDHGHGAGHDDHGHAGHGGGHGHGH